MERGLLSFLKIDFKNSSITFDDKQYSIDPVGEAAQEIIIAGGLESWVKRTIEHR